MSHSTQPNILLITSDQQHFSTLGATNPKIHTPNLDRLCHEGTRFDRAYCPNPTCSPTRASLITGLYPSMHGCWSIGTKLDERMPTLGDRLQEAGYATHLIGKLHVQPLKSTEDQPSWEAQPTLRDLDYWRHFWGPWYGFERAEVARMHTNESHAGQHYAIWMEEKGLTNWADYFRPWPDKEYPDHPQMKLAREAPVTWDIPEHYHYNYWIAERTIANVEQAHSEGRPFFTWASYFDPHFPQMVPEPWASMYDPAEMEPGELTDDELAHMPKPHQLTQDPNADFSAWQEAHANHGYHYHPHGQDRAWLQRMMAVYYGMVSFMDHTIGQILDRLDELGIADNTLIVYTTDHGDFLGQHGMHMKGPFHYEDLLKLPFIVRWPNEVPAGRATEALQSLVDLPPTFLAAAGAPIPLYMQGVSQLEVWRGNEPAARDHVMVEMRHQPTAVHIRTYIDQRYKLTVHRNDADGELFDLEQDPYEKRNRWDDPDWQGLRCRLMHRMLQAEMEREPQISRRVASA